MVLIFRRFSERQPRVYGLLMLVTGIALGFICQSIATTEVAFLMTFLCAGGICYLVFGSLAYCWDMRFQVRFFPPTSLSWRQTCTVIASGLGLLNTTGLLYWILR